MDAIRLQAAAQELVDLTRKQKSLEDQILQLKLTIYDQVEGTMHCVGGKIISNPKVTHAEIDESRLREALRQLYDLPEAQINRFIESSRRIEPYPSLEVILE